MKRKKQTRLLILSVISGVLLGLPWLEWFSGIILLIAFVPLLFVEDYFTRNKDRNRPIVLFGFAFFAFILWNIIAVCWIYKVTVAGAFFVILTNSLLLALVFFLFHATKRNLGENFGYFSLFVYWLGWEYFMMNAELHFPWLSLGNGLAKDIGLIQWYEYTGVLGGSLWILMLNLLLFSVLRHYIIHRTFRGKVGRMVFVLIMIILPLLASSHLMRNYNVDNHKVKIGLIQPNIDPYNEKYNGLNQEQQIDRVLKLGRTIADSSMGLIIAPETTIHENLWEEELDSHLSVKKIYEFVDQYPRIRFILGVDMRKKLRHPREIPPEASKSEQNGDLVMRYNAAIQLDSSSNIPIYYKSKLVNGIEKVPYPGIFQFLDSWLVDVGDEIGSLGTQEKREVFVSTVNDVSIAPVICYESVFGEFVTEYVHQGAELIVVLTNDGWFGQTQGYKQHLNFARLRAIETRRGIARCANTGISALINQKGELIKSTKWWEQSAITGTLTTSQKQTFYTRFGDYIGRISAFLGIFALLYLVAKVFMQRSKYSEIMRLRQ